MSTVGTLVLIGDLDVQPPGPSAPPPPPPPPGTGSPGTGGIVQSLPAGTSLTTFYASLRDMGIDVIELAAGSYSWDGAMIDVDRTARPLEIRPAAGALVRFTGNGSTSAGIFFIGLNRYTAFITMRGFTFDGIGLAQAGVFEIRSSYFCSFLDMTFMNLTRDHAWKGAAVYKSWCAYISVGSGVRNNDGLVIDNWLLHAPSIARDLSAIQVASSVVPNGSIHISRITMTDYDYVLYVETPTADLQVTDITAANCGNASTPASLSFQAVKIDGFYHNVVLTGGSSPIRNLSTGTMHLA